MRAASLLLSVLFFGLTAQAGVFHLDLTINNGPNETSEVTFADGLKLKMLAERKGGAPEPHAFNFRTNATVEFIDLNVVRFIFEQPISFRFRKTPSAKILTQTLTHIDVNVGPSGVVALKKLDSLKADEVLLSAQEFVLNRFYELLNTAGPQFFIHQQYTVPEALAFDGHLGFYIDINDLFLNRATAPESLPVLLTPIEGVEQGEPIFGYSTRIHPLSEIKYFSVVSEKDERIHKLITVQTQIAEAAFTETLKQASAPVPPTQEIKPNNVVTFCRKSLSEKGPLKPQ